jgi:hypothetical protein
MQGASSEGILSEGALISSPVSVPQQAAQWRGGRSGGATCPATLKVVGMDNDQERVVCQSSLLEPPLVKVAGSRPIQDCGLEAVS